MEPPARSSPPEPDPAGTATTDPEQQAIRRVLQHRPRPPGGPALLVEVGDDAAVLPGGLTWTTDTLVEGRHFDRRLAAGDVGFKALAVSVSDLAAMGARPSWALLALALGPSADDVWQASFARGLGEALERWSIHLIGGDTVFTDGPTVATIALGGTVVARPQVRTGARPGDRLWVTGIPGLAGSGWRSATPHPEALDALRRPDPPLDLALDLAESGLVSAMMDLSDGLGADVPRLAAASGVDLVLEPQALPDHVALMDDPAGHRFLGGDDYQLLFTAPPAATVGLTTLAGRHGRPLTAIGRAESASGPVGVGRLRDGAWPGRFGHRVAGGAG